MLEGYQTCTYLGIVHGKLAQRVPAGTDGATQRLTKTGATVHEKYYRFVKGMLTEIGVAEHEEYGKQWVFNLEDGAEAYRLQLSENSRVLTSLLFALPSCDLKKPIAIHPYDFADKDGKNHTGVTLKQDGEKVGWFFTREEPKGLPELRAVTVDGKEAWDSSERMRFLHSYVNQHIIPLLPATSVAAETNDDVLPPNMAESNPDPDLDDLTF